MQTFFIIGYCVLDSDWSVAENVVFQTKQITKLILITNNQYVVI